MRFRIGHLLWLMALAAAFFSGRWTMEEKVRLAYEDLACSQTSLTCYEPIEIFEPDDPTQPWTKIPENHKCGWFGNKLIHQRLIAKPLTEAHHGPSHQAQKYIPKMPNWSYYKMTGSLCMPE